MPNYSHSTLIFRLTKSSGKELGFRGGNPAWLAAAAAGLVGTLLPVTRAAEDDLGLSDEVVPYEEIGEDFVERPKPVTEKIEDMLFPVNREREEALKKRNEGDTEVEVPQRKTIFGRNPFLGTGEITPGFETPFGAVWQPSLIIYGEYRTAVQTFNNGDAEFSEWANRLDLFTNLYLTPTERIILGLRPFDDIRTGEFSGRSFGGDGGSEWVDGFNLEIRNLFFEGDFGELFPNLDPEDRLSLDYGFSIGRQPLLFQDGIMINDDFDAVGITRSSLFFLGSSATRITAVYGRNEIHRGDNVLDRDAQLYGLFFSSDYAKATYDLDLAYVDGSAESGGDGFYAGIAQTRRFGHYNSTLRANFSWALDEETTAVSNGSLLTAQISRHPRRNYDLVYLNAFWGIDDYTSAARDPATGGPLGNIGILFAAVGLGNYGAPLGNRANQAVGAAVGYQHFFDKDKTRQIIFELGGRTSTNSGMDDAAGALGVQYQRALNQHAIFVLGGFGSAHEERGGGYGARAEMRIKF